MTNGNKKVIEETRWDSRTVHYVAAGNLQDIIVKSLREFKKKEGNWATFDEFRKFNYTTWAICIDESTCSCPYFQKIGQCKHFVGMMVRLKKIAVPGAVKSVPLGQPSKSKPALIVQ